MQSQTRCPECDLIFSRLEFASNKAAKKQLRKFNRDYVVYTKDLPKDVSFIKLLLLTIFCGLFGAQYYYVGKYEKGILMTVSFVYLVLCTIFNAYIVEYMQFLYFPIGLAGIAWMVSIVYVGSRKFKVPILIDMPTAESVESETKKEKNNKKTTQNSEKNVKKVEKTEKVEEIIEKIEKAQQKEDK